jgi:phosphatidylglycerophosphatase A
VYMDHHWIVDVLLGIAYALIGHRFVGALLAIRKHRTPAAASTPVGHDGKSRAAFALATWFGCGRVPFAPGTAGTLGALPLYLLVRPLGALAVLGAAVAVTVAGVWSASIVCRETALKDPQFVVIDEVAGVLLTLAATPPTAVGAIAAVVAFRAFDTLKPWPAYVAERDLPGGWGVVFDDVFAGAWGAATITFLANTGAL